MVHRPLLPIGNEPEDEVPLPAVQRLDADAIDDQQCHLCVLFAALPRGRQNLVAPGGVGHVIEPEDCAVPTRT